MPARTKKPAPEVLAPDDMPPVRAGKPDTSTVYLGGLVGARVTYTDPEGVPHAEECAMDQIRPTTMRLAQAFGAKG